MRYFFGKSVLVILCLTLAQCGFYLRGKEANTIELPHISIETDNRYSDFITALRQVAIMHQIDIDPTANWKIQIQHQNINKQRVTSSLTAQQDRFTLNFTVQHALQHCQGDNTVALGPLVSQAETVFQSNENDPAGKFNEEQLLIEELKEQVAQQILRRTALLIQSPPECAKLNEN